MSRARVVASCLAILSLATAVIHFAVAGEHFAECWLFARCNAAPATDQQQAAVAMVDTSWPGAGGRRRGRRR